MHSARTIFKTLRRQARLHPSLAVRLEALSAAALVFLVILIYELHLSGGHYVVALIAALLGGAFGYYLVLQSGARWNDERTIIDAEQMTVVGFIILALLLMLKLLLAAASTAPAYFIALLFGFLVGRTIGIIAEIARAHPRA